MDKESLHLNDLPEELFENEPNILDIGSGFGQHQLESKHEKYFTDLNLKGKYLGIEKKLREYPLLNIKEMDFFNYRSSEKFDLILMTEFVEHISLYKWGELFYKVRKIVGQNGKIVLTTPYLEQKKDYLPTETKEELQKHVVFNINKWLIGLFLPNAEYTIIKINSWKFNNGNYLFSCGRAIKRLMTLHPYYFTYKRRKRLIAIWSNKNETIIY